MREQLTKCTIDIIIFHNEANGYTIMKCKRESGPLVTVIGSMNEPRIGNTFNFTGEWKQNPKYGRQFVFDSFEEIFPTTPESIFKYLSSGLIKGVGPDLAQKIIDTLGEDTLNIIDTDPDRLLEVKGIGPKKLAQIKDSWKEYRKLQNIMIFLKAHDISTSLAMKIYTQYGDESIKIMKANPYKLTEIEGIGFMTADGAAMKMGFTLEDKRRLWSGILYTIKNFEKDGNCFVYKADLIKSASEILEVTPSLVESVLYEMIDAHDVIRDEGDALYHHSMYYIEKRTAKKLRDIAHCFWTGNFTELDVRRELNGGYVDNYKLNDEQINAIISTLNNKVSVITGGPGTGKTTTIRGVVNIERSNGKKIFLAAPTGRAAKKLAEKTKMEASTIHRLLGFTPAGCDKNEKNPLEGNLLIVDECSMIDITLMYRLLKAVPTGMKLLLVGDVDQLPSIGPGRVFADIIDSGVAAVTRLTKIHRQEEGSIIAENAERINNGDMPYMHNLEEESEFYFSEIRDQEAAANYIVDKYKKIITEGIARHEHPDVQVLSPMRKGIVGINNLNSMLQDALNPVQYELTDFFRKKPLLITRGETEYRLGDKVMQIRNNYDKKVFNGDIGRISYIDRENNELTVSYDETRNIKYAYLELEELVLAYAVTIHKSQGSEYDTVIMPIMKSQFIMLQRNLLYTAITRAKKKLIMAGEEKAVYIAVRNNEIARRNTRLIQRLQDKSLDYEENNLFSEFEHNDDYDDA